MMGYNNFQNIRHLNVGGFGEIFEATLVNLLGEKIKFALKYLKSSKGYSIDIVDEVISHEITYSDDYILKYYGLTQDLELNKTFIVMEYVEGGNLFDRLSKGYRDISWQKKTHNITVNRNRIDTNSWA
ncbi:serine/threonine protein kinase [Gigaspora margarita]|uniref:Serine/threonine protein kinase n=1 Tax=Gigaspora margarita TaxID=4874 RepID=A0A8H3X111_GIGMA|nr:serine/threonine protein kinase [Gigaspora margarita]